MTAARAAVIAPLLNAQPWLNVEWSPLPVISDLNGFRDHCRAAATIAGSPSRGHWHGAWHTRGRCQPPVVGGASTSGSAA